MMRSQRNILLVLAVALSLGAGLCGAPLWQAPLPQAPLPQVPLPQVPRAALFPPIDPLDPLDPIDSDPHVRFEFEARPAMIKPKFRIRDGEASLKPTSIFSSELDLEDWEFSPGGSARVLVDNERFTLSYWHLRAEGSDRLTEPKNFAGSTLPVGTLADSHVTWDFWSLDWRHRFELSENAWFDAGLAVQYLVFDADLGFGSTRLSGVYPSPQIAFITRPVEWFELEAYAGGFYLPFRNGDTRIRKPLQYGAEVRVLGDDWSLGLGYDMFHVHLEENSGDIDEDIVHSRLQGVHLSLTVQF